MQTRTALQALIAGQLLVTLALGVGAQEITNEDCLTCHGMEGFSGSGGKSLFIAGEAFSQSTHGPLPCTTCHADATEIPHAEKLAPVGADTCATCHGDAFTAYEESAHGRARANGTTDAASCRSCHGSAHTVRPHSDPASPVYPLNLPRTCGACHGDPELAKRHGIPVVDAYQMYMDSIHGRVLTGSGLLVAANCSSCHGFHEIRPKEDSQSRVFRGNVPSTCGACHAGAEKAYFEGTHGQALAAGNPKAPVCVDCHTAHQIARVDTTPWKLQVVQECGTCHEESLRTYRDTFHGQVTALGFTPVARCADCHGSHRVLPASDPLSSISAQNLVATCQKCHPDANANFVQFAPHADPDDKEGYPILYYTALFMELLIIGVFAFFGLHTVLWFIRSLVEQRRGPQPPKPAGASQGAKEQ